MGFGAYDESEHEQREDNKEIDTDQNSTRTTHNGTVSHGEESDVDEMLDKFEEIKEQE